MAAAAETSVHSPRSPASGRLPAPSPHAVRGEPEPSPATDSVDSLEPSDQPLPLNPSPVDASAEHGSGGGSDGGAGRLKKLAWSRPANGVGEAGVAVMGAVSWPALSECTRSSPKSSPAETLKSSSDGSASTTPDTVIASPPRNPSSGIPNPNPNTNQSQHSRQRSMKRGNMSPNGGPLTPVSVVSGEMFMHNTAPDKYAGWEHSPRGNTPSGTMEYGSRAHGSGDHQRTYGGNRRGNNGGGYGGRREQERGGGGGGGGYEWNQSRNFSGRDIRMQLPLARGVPRTFIGPPSPSTAPFMGRPPPVGPYVNPMGFTDMPSPVFYISAPPEPPRGISFVSPSVPPLMFMAPPDHGAILVRQIDYYFSPENLCKDIYLRQNMDDNGWVHVSLIANFNRVKQLTNNIQYILEAIRASEIVEVQGDKLRRRDDWMNWVLPPSPGPYGPGSRSPAISKHDPLVAHMQNVALEDSINQNAISGSNIHEPVLNKSGFAM